MQSVYLTKGFSWCLYFKHDFLLAVSSESHWSVHRTGLDGSVRPRPKVRGDGCRYFGNL